MKYWQKIRVKYSGLCKNCNGEIKEGEEAYYLEKDTSSLVVIDEEDKKLLGL